MPEKRLLSLKKAACYLDRSVWSIRGMIWRGDLPYLAEGRKWYIDRRDLDEYIEKTKKTLQYPDPRRIL